MRLVLLAALLLFTACDGDDTFDAGPRLDAGSGAMDSGAPHDAGPGGEDAGSNDDAGVDAGVSDAGPGMPVGTISGSCGDIDTELLDAMPHYFEGAIDFPAPVRMADLPRFSEGAQELIMEGTIGGSSIYSEATSFEVLARCEGAELIKSESEIIYTVSMTDRTDYLARIHGEPIGVSVARAVGFPREDPYPVSAALTLLERKLMGVLESSANVSPEDAWVKQILHIIAYSPMHEDSIMTAWAMIDPAVRADTVLLVTVTNGEDAFIYDDALAP